MKAFASVAATSYCIGCLIVPITTTHSWVLRLPYSLMRTRFHTDTGTNNNQHQRAELLVLQESGSDTTDNNNNNNNNNKENTVGPPKEEFLDDCDADPEGECEIDWDKMFPTETNNNASSNTNDEYSSSNADSSSPAPNNDDDNTIMSLEEELFELLQDHRDQVLQKSSHTDPSQARLQLEMAWQMQQQKDECEVEQPETCSDRCLSCHGTGNVLCRFCQGTKVLALQGMAQPQACNVCQAQGIEECAPCRGAGWIANWTQLKLQAPV